MGRARLVCVACGAERPGVCFLQAYLAIVMVLRLSNIVMRRIYLPCVASRPPRSRLFSLLSSLLSALFGRADARRHGQVHSLRGQDLRGALAGVRGPHVGGGAGALLGRHGERAVRGRVRPVRADRRVLPAPLERVPAHHRERRALPPLSSSVVRGLIAGWSMSGLLRVYMRLARVVPVEVAPASVARTSLGLA